MIVFDSSERLVGLLEAVCQSSRNRARRFPFVLRACAAISPCNPTHAAWFAGVRGSFSSTNIQTVPRYHFIYLYDGGPFAFPPNPQTSPKKVGRETTLSVVTAPPSSGEGGKLDRQQQQGTSSKPASVGSNASSC